MSGFATGGCLCGKVRYECQSPPLMSGNCHCRDCQKATGAAFATLLIFPKDTVSITGSTFREFQDSGDSGKEVRRGFCDQCGGSISAWYEVTPDFMVVMAGTIDEVSKVTPEWEIYTTSKQDWTVFPPDHKVFPRGYGSS